MKITIHKMSPTGMIAIVHLVIVTWLLACANYDMPIIDPSESTVGSMLSVLLWPLVFLLQLQPMVHLLSFRDDGPDPATTIGMVCVVVVGSAYLWGTIFGAFFSGIAEGLAKDSQKKRSEDTGDT